MADSKYIHFLFFNTAHRRNHARGWLWERMDERNVTFDSHNHKLSDDADNNLYRLSFWTSEQITADEKAKVIKALHPWAHLFNETPSIPD